MSHYWLSFRAQTRNLLFARSRREGLQDLLQCLLKNCTARSCFCAAASEPNVPKFFRLPVFASFLREYSRYSPDFSLRIMSRRCAGSRWGWKKGTGKLRHEVLRRRMMHDDRRGALLRLQEKP